VFGARLRAARTALGLTRTQAADRWDVSHHTLEAWEVVASCWPAPFAVTFPI
jgi:DNA-binding XRE family transcriptional regulator